MCEKPGGEQFNCPFGEGVVKTAAEMHGVMRLS
jgi:hypothetical protein